MTNLADDESFDDFVRNLQLTPREVRALDRDGRSRIMSVCAEISGIPEGIDQDLPPALLAAAIVEAESDSTFRGHLDAESSRLSEAIEVYSGVVHTRTRQEGPRSPRVLNAQGRLAELYAATGDLKRARGIYAEIHRHTDATSRKVDQAEAALELLHGRVREFASRAASFRDWMNRKRRITPLVPHLVDELYSEAVDNPAAARVRVVDGVSLATPLPVSRVMEAALEAGVQVFVVPHFRGTRWRQRYADLVVFRSALTDGTPAEHREHILGRPYGPSGATLQDAIFAAGAVPEVSQVLLNEFGDRYHLDDHDVVIHCPYYLRNHPDRDPRIDEQPALDPDRPAPQDTLGGVVVTSLGWGGAANVGAQLARWWGWGLTIAAQANLAGLDTAYSFGDWSDSPQHNLRHGDVARRLVAESRTLLDALRSLSQRVVVLDHPGGAIQALNELGDDASNNPPALVAIRMDPRRVRYVARHILSGGGRSPVNDDKVTAFAIELQLVQEELISAVERHRRHCPVVVVDLHDHLEDGYAESTAAMDPVDSDFDSFYATAVEVRDQLNARLPKLSDELQPAHD